MSRNTLSPLARLLALVAALFITSITFWGTTATAAGPAFYQADLAAPTTETKFVARDVIWQCAGQTCAAPKGTVRPAVMCAALARQVGNVARFTAAGKALTAEELAKCNARA